MHNWLTILMMILTPFLLFIYLNQRKQLHRVNQILEEIQQGKVNQRFEVQSSDRVIRELCENLNVILDQLHVTVQHARYLEKGRKQMIANLSKDLCTPLVSMLSDLEAFTEEEGWNKERWQNDLKVITLKGDQLSDRLQHFFELVKLEAE